MNKEIILYKEESECCGCSACMNICPKNAISMEYNNNGYTFPVINEDLCITCGLCEKVCNYKNYEEKNEPIDAYAVASKKTNQNNNFASGGAFTIIATKVLKLGGVVFGAAYNYEKSNIGPVHCCIESVEDIYKLQGSKYAQSSIDKTFIQAKQYLDEGRNVLFSGTPCQIAGLNGYLIKKYDNLITVDLVCHGTPSSKMFNDYINRVESSENAKVVKFRFRDKNIGWKHNASMVLLNKSGKEKYKKITWQTSSYYYMFMRSWAYRESCYKCKYASKHRPADITLGDFWGIQNEHPELLVENGGVLSEKEGISCVLINTDKGSQFFENCKVEMNWFPSTYEKIVRKNPMLDHPVKRPKIKDEVIKQYSDFGYEAVEKYYRKKLGYRWYVYMIKDLLPNNIKNVLKKFE